MERGVASKPGWELVQGYIEALLANKSTGAILDIGANNGAWARGTLRACRKRGVTVSPRLLLVEPQTEFRPALESLASKWGGKLLGRAAWVRDQQLVFHLSSNSEAASVQESMARRGGGLASAERVEVPAVDIARVVHLALQGVQGPVLLKLDIEAAEYDVLPRLLVTGALCRVDFLLLEWHLNALKPSRRFAGFALRHTIDSLLHAGCSAPPQRVFHDEYFTNNFGHVPGLGEAARRHRSTEDRRWDQSEAHRVAPLSSAQLEGAGAWLRLARNGACGKTTKGRGDCAAGSKGVFPLNASSFSGGWSTATHACVAACQQCKRCRFVSLSLRWADCSWFRACSRLDARVPGFRSIEIRGT